MKRKQPLPELLAPAGDFSALLAAVCGGADAIYVGGKSFGARAYAKNFDIEELSRAVIYCHLHGVKLYVTVNTLLFDKEVKTLIDYLRELYRIGVDAIISADLGVIKIAREILPDLEIHGSTQMSVHNSLGADTAYALGCERVVLARELSLSDIRDVCEKSKAEIEVFLHGALCVCHSGQCLMSSLVGGRSGNRGECAQPCRLPYNNGKYPISLSDLSLANHVPELIESGVASLKIEGRMKSAHYVYTVTSVYRRLLDERRGATPEENAILRSAFSRGEFTDAYFVGDKQRKMTGVRSEADKQLTRGAEERKFEPIRVGVCARCKIKRGEPSELTLIMKDRSVSVTGDIPTEAINAPLTESAVKERLAKMGATYLSLDTGDIELTLDEGLNLSPGAINALRRDAVSLVQSAERECPEPKVLSTRKTPSKKLKTALFLLPDLYERLASTSSLSDFDVIFLPIDYFKEKRNLKSDKIGIYLPPIIFEGEIESAKALIKEACNMGAKYALVGNIGHISLISDYPLTPIGDFRLNITNTYTRGVYSSLGINNTVLSPELTLPMARDIGGGEIVYGRIPLMLTERCFIKENFGCSRCNSAALSDRTGASFPLLYEWGHRNLILNSDRTYMGDKKRELYAAGIFHEHFIFSVESVKDAQKILSFYKSGQPLENVRRIGKR